MVTCSRAVDNTHQVKNILANTTHSLASSDSVVSAPRKTSVPTGSDSSPPILSKAFEVDLGTL